jgi:hypothetical protein
MLVIRKDQMNALAADRASTRRRRIVDQAVEIVVANEPRADRAEIRARLDDAYGEIEGRAVFGERARVRALVAWVSAGGEPLGPQSPKSSSSSA